MFTFAPSKKLQSMCKVDKETITRVNNSMISHVKVGTIQAQNSRDGHIVIPVHVLGSRQYKMSIDRVNEIYGQARKKVIGSVVHPK